MFTQCFEKSSQHVLGVRVGRYFASLVAIAICSIFFLRKFVNYNVIVAFYCHVIFKIIFNQ